MLRALTFLAVCATPVWADAPKVTTDIAPVHSLVSQVMLGVGTPELLVPSNTSPHDFALRPSQGRMLSDADLVVFVGPSLTPWLEDAVETLAESAAHLALMDVEGMTLMPFREGALFEAHDHADEHEHAHGEDEEKHHDNHAEHVEHDEHEEHVEHDAHKDHDDHEEHASHDEGEGHDDHEHHTGGMDPHIWLDPLNGSAALVAIAKALSEIDPENAATYQSNAASGQAVIAAATARIGQQLNSVQGQPFVVFHDAYHYFEARFGVEAVASVSEGDAASPGAARIAELREHIAETGAVCAFAEPQMNTALLETVVEGQPTKLSVIDPLGATLTPGPELYPQVLQGMADVLADCLTPSG